MTTVCAFSVYHERLLKWIVKSIKKEKKLPIVKRYWWRIYQTYIHNINGLTIIQSPLRDCLNESCFHYMLLETELHFTSFESCPQKALESK